MKSLLNNLDSSLAKLWRFSLVFLTLLLTAIMAFAVFMRYVVDTAFPAVEELSILIGLWLYFISIVVVTRERGHLTGGILELLNLSARNQALIKAFNDLVGLLVIGCFGFYTIKYLLFVIKINRVSTNLAWPTSIWVAAAVLGFSLMALYKLRDLFIHHNRYTIYDNKSLHAKDAQLEQGK